MPIYDSLKQLEPDLMKRIRRALAEGRFAAFAESFMRLDAVNPRTGPRRRMAARRAGFHSP